MLIESLAREHGRNGVHACHVIVDGLLDTEAVARQMGPPAELHEVGCLPPIPFTRREGEQLTWSQFSTAYQCA